ncbi:hypothetical protein TNCV_1745801 [Trichonephila clavipes]|nr:hypothetical protein TNCV_1745801 [Trichonephila clavipes]
MQFGYYYSCKEQLPASGNRSNERRYREEDLATRGEKRSERERRERNPAVYLQVDDHVHPGIALQQFQVKKTRPSSYGVLPSPAELGYERTDAVFFFSF